MPWSEKKMKPKTKFIALLISMAITTILIGVGWFWHHNPFTLWVGGFFLLVYFPIHIWDALSRMKTEKEWKKRSNKSMQQLFNIYDRKDHDHDHDGDNDHDNDRDRDND
jgi:ABC-type nickel/cobalt efflux system permease component RcnA